MIRELARTIYLGVCIALGLFLVGASAGLVAFGFCFVAICR